VLIGSVTTMVISGKSVYSVNSYFDNKGDVYLQC